MSLAFLLCSSRFPSLPPEVMQLVKSCLHPDPARRLTCDELLKLPYFRGVEALVPGMAAVAFKAGGIINAPMIPLASRGHVLAAPKPSQLSAISALPPIGSQASNQPPPKAHEAPYKGPTPLQPLQPEPKPSEAGAMSIDRGQRQADDLPERTRAAIAQARATVAAAAEAVEHSEGGLPILTVPVAQTRSNMPRQPMPTAAVETAATLDEERRFKRASCDGAYASSSSSVVAPASSRPNLPSVYSMVNSRKGPEGNMPLTTALTSKPHMQISPTYPSKAVGTMHTRGHSAAGAASTTCIPQGYHSFGSRISDLGSKTMSSELRAVEGEAVPPRAWSALPVIQHLACTIPFAQKPPPGPHNHGGECRHKRTGSSGGGLPLDVPSISDRAAPMASGTPSVLISPSESSSLPPPRLLMPLRAVQRSNSDSGVSTWVSSVGGGNRKPGMHPPQHRKSPLPSLPATRGKQTSVLKKSHSLDGRSLGCQPDPKIAQIMAVYRDDSGAQDSGGRSAKLKQELQSAALK